MHKSLALFSANMADTRNIAALHEYLSTTVIIPQSFDDLLRSQIVYAVSAFDKLMHDLVRIGIVEIFSGKRNATPKYLSEPIPMQIHSALVSATFPPKEHIFEQAIFQKLKTVSYQDPSKVADGLSYIWDEPQKWQKIASAMNSSEKTVKTTLKLIADKRNTIVHEADINPMTNTKYSTSKAETGDCVNFLDRCGNEIARLATIIN